MPNSQQILGLTELWAKTQGDPDICVAVLDGIVDRDHPCFVGANISRLSGLVSGDALASESMSTHGTH